MTKGHQLVNYICTKIDKDKRLSDSNIIKYLYTMNDLEIKEAINK